MSECPLCAGSLATEFVYDAPPPGETAFDIPPGAYHRSYARCGRCGLFVADPGSIDLDGLYAGGYVDATYSDAAGLADTYERIMALTPERSDNAGRVERVVAWMGDRRPRTLDVGSGLGVFPARMKAEGFDDVVALDPDPRAARHIREHAGVESVVADFMRSDDLGGFGLITLNKVLEHVARPVVMLARTRHYLEPGGVVYVELPDAAAAGDPDGQNREEFFLEHRFVFGPASLALLARRAGFEVRRLESLREPSGKYTVYAFLNVVSL